MNIIKNKEGIALITVLILLLVVGTLTSALMMMYTSNISRAGNSAERNRAFYAAEGGANYLNVNINKNAEVKDIMFQPLMEGELRNLTGDLTDDFFDEFDSFDSDDFDDPIFKFGLADDLKINGFDLSFSFDESSLKREDEIYGFIIEASNGRISEKIRLIYQIQSLPPFFRSSRQANKITFENSSFGNGEFPVNSFATAEMYYEEWEKDLIYSAGDFVYYDGNNYRATEDYDSEKCSKPGSNNCWYNIGKGPDLREQDKLHNIENEDSQYDAVDYGMNVLPPQPPKKSWISGENYSEEDKVINIIDDEEKYYISDVDNPQTEPGVDDGWESEWQEYYNYKKEVVEVFDGLIAENGGKVYSEPDYEVYNGSDSSYNVGDKVIKDGKIKQFRWVGFIFRRKEWVTINEKLAYEKFLKDSSYNVGPYIKIDGDFAPTKEYTKNFDNMKTDENGVLHVLIAGDVDITNYSVDFEGDKNIILYVNGNLNFNPRGIDMSGLKKNGGQLGYFAPNATFTFKNQGNEPHRTVSFGSSMVVNEFKIINSEIDGVTYDTEDSSLIGMMDPKISELSRSLAAAGNRGKGIGSEINPIRQSWEQIK